jgi:N6-adenosine-specific RNA methylase IME4
MNALAKYEAARKALAEASRVDEVKEIRDVGIALATYARLAKDSELIDRATDIRMRAERRLGEMLGAQKATVGFATGAAGIGPIAVPEKYRNQPPTLAEAGIDKKLSARSQKLAALPEAEFEQIVEAAKKQAVASVASTRAERVAEKKERRARLEAELGAKIMALPTQKFSVIYADPAWKFKVWSETGALAVADNHYATSELEAIKALDVASIAAVNAAMFLWATAPMLPQALEVMAAWGFAYKTHFVWAKDKFGTGYWNRNMHELLLVGTRGDVPIPAPGTQWDSIVDAPRGAHSEKPEIFYELIADYFPSWPKVELYARERRAGWASWGTLENELDSRAAAI